MGQEVGRRKSTRREGRQGREMKRSWEMCEEYKKEGKVSKRGAKRKKRNIRGRTKAGS